MKQKKLSESRREVIRFLGRGHHIYLDDRGKWRMSAQKMSDGSWKSANCGHTNAYYSSGASGTHLYRPTVEFLAKEGIAIGYFNADGLPCYHLIEEYDEESTCFAEEIKMASVEGALGVTR